MVLRKVELTAEKPFASCKALLRRVRDKSATQTEVNRFISFLRDYIEDVPCGTIANFGSTDEQEVIRVIEENYPEIDDISELRRISKEKIVKLYNVLYENAKENMRMNIHPVQLKMLFDFMTGENNDGVKCGITVVNTGFKLSEGGNFITAEVKEESSSSV